MTPSTMHGRNRMSSLIFEILTANFILTCTALTTNSACFGDAATNKTKLYLHCPTGSTIDVANATVGAKMTSSGCPRTYMDVTKDAACCSPSANISDDCTFLVDNISAFQVSCDGTQSCELEAKNEFTAGHCNHKNSFPPSTIYMFIEYECITPTQPNAAENNNAEFPVWGIVLIVLAGM